MFPSNLITEVPNGFYVKEGMPHKARVMGKNVKYHHIRKLLYEYSKTCPEPLIPTTDKTESKQQMFNGSS